MLFFSLFNYNALRTLKDSFIVPNIGAEAISFIKFFCVVPASIIFVLIYIKMTDRLSFRQIYFYIASFFITFFILFGFVLYPNELLIHPSLSLLENLMSLGSDLWGYQIHGSHFKWFFLVYSKWLYAVFYIIAELWSVMSALLFWQFANQITTTNESKRFYPILAFMGSFGTFTAGCSIKLVSTLTEIYNQDLLFQIQLMMSILTVSSLLIMMIFEYMFRRVVRKSEELNAIVKQSKTAEMGMLQSLKTILSSRYLGYMVVIVIGYGVTLNLMEGPWKASIRELFPNTQDYIYFMAGVNQWMGATSMLFILIGAYILRKYSWLLAAQITPLVFLVVGGLFFTFLILKDEFHLYLGGFLVFDPLVVAVYTGMTQVVIGKSTKYALFDATKEMAYIPISNQLKSKGKAAVDVIGARLSRSVASFIQAAIFIIFPAATYLTISKVLMGVFVIMVVIWVIAIRLLNKDYLEQLENNKAD